MRRRHSHRRVVLALAAVAVAAGCQPTAKISPALPAVRLNASAIPGTLLDATPATRPSPSPDAVGVLVTWCVVTRVPDDLLDPLDAHATLVSAPLAGGPLLTSGRQTAAARFGDGESADQFLKRLLARTDGPVVQIGYQAGVIVPGSTTTFRLSADRADAAAPGRAVAVSLYVPLDATTRAATEPATTRSVTTRPAGSMTVTLEGFRDTPTTGDDAPTTRPSITLTPETAYLDGVSLKPGRRYAMAFPCRLGNTPWRGIVVFIDIVKPPENTNELATLANEQFAGPSATQPATQPAVRTTLTRAIDALKTSADPRPPLLFLATATRAAIAADAILIADKPTLDRLRSELLLYAKDHDAADAGLDAAGLGWHLDRSAVLSLCEQQQAGKLPAELAAVLVVHGGEVGRHADALADAAKNVGSAADLKARLIGENTIALEDNSPSARVRAFDWLKGQGRAPEGYDPLADAHARRAAINRAISNSGGTR